MRKVWEDFRNKNKTSLGAALADGFREMEEGGQRLWRQESRDRFGGRIRTHQLLLKDFAVKSLGPRSALVTYSAHYEGKSAGQTQKSDSIFGEVWVHEGKTDWKVLYIQETMR